MNPALLSKRRFLAGHQCLLKMWNQFHRRELAARFSGFQNVLFKGGIQVEELARTKYPKGVQIPHRQITSTEAAHQTLDALTDHKTSAIFDGAFTFQNTFIRTDILAKTPEGSWDLLEVKSTTRVRQSHLVDLALQLWMLRSLGIDVDRAGMLTVNKNYQFQGGDIELEKYFNFTDCTDDLDDLMTQAEQSVKKFSIILNDEIPPVVRQGKQCSKPHPCSFYDHCHDEPVEELPYPITLLPQLSGHLRNRLEKQNITDVRELTDSKDLGPIQMRALRCIKSGLPEGSDKLASEISKVQYPIHHIDFESFMNAIPAYPHSRPYDSIPFQWSNHIEHEDGTIEHQEFLWPHKSDPREAFTKSLLESLGDTGTICIYSNYEEVEIAQMAKLFPELSVPLKALLKRTWDVMVLLRDHFYHPGFLGSFSIKRVLPALAPHLRYEELEISDGKAAMHEYLRSIELESDEEREEIHKQLLVYCAMDTQALIEIRKYLKTWVESQPTA